MTPSKTDINLIQRPECNDRHGTMYRLIGIIGAIIMTLGGYLFSSVSAHTRDLGVLNEKATYQERKLSEISTDVKDIKRDIMKALMGKDAAPAR